MRLTLCRDHLHVLVALHDLLDAREREDVRLKVRRLLFSEPHPRRPEGLEELTRGLSCQPLVWERRA